MMQPDWNYHFPFPDRFPHDDDEDDHGKIFRVVATRQNTIKMPHPDDPDACPRLQILRPQTRGGPDVWEWHLANTGGSDLFLRWDGIHTAYEDDPHSFKLAQDKEIKFKAGILTVAGSGEFSLTVSNTQD